MHQETIAPPPAQPGALAPCTDSGDVAVPSGVAGKIWSDPPLLRGERAADFHALVAALVGEIKPRGVIEELYVGDIAWLVWETNRLRRNRTPIILAGYRAALERLLAPLIEEPGEPGSSVRDRAQELARNWFADEAGKKEVREILAAFDLDESVVEAQAVRRSADELASLDKLLMALEARRDKALGCIARYRASLARELRASSDRLIEASADGPRLQAAARIAPE